MIWRRDAVPTARAEIELVRCQIECRMRTFQGISGGRNSTDIRNLLIRLRPSSASSSPRLNRLRLLPHGLPGRREKEAGPSTGTQPYRSWHGGSVTALKTALGIRWDERGLAGE